MIAQHARLGNITESSLNDSISRFKRFVNDFKQKNKINYDLDERKSAAKRNAEYISAVESGDMATAQRMVDEATKAAGYDSPKLYHGTSKFGFTEFKPELADDQISFFATNDERVATTYSGPTPARVPSSG